MKKSFEISVGVDEIHKLFFSYSKVWGTLSVMDNGMEVYSSTNPVVLPSHSAIEINVGEKEKHKIKFEIITPKLFRAFRESKIRVYIDNEFVKEY